MTTIDLFAKYDVPVPRYTSYPTVPAWHETPTAGEWTASLARALDDPVAIVDLYVHLPFCESLCTFCGCNTIITRDHGRARPYVDHVLRELDRYLAAVPALAERVVGRIHLGGGTPTFSPPEVLGDLVDGIFARVPRAAAGFEGSVEADPRVTSPAHLEALAARGFTRLSLGVQDFHEETQRLVNRVQSVDLVAALVGAGRAAGYASINVDLIYGLPGQSVCSMRATAAHVVGLAPDRVAVYSFARVPWIKPQQRTFTDAQVPAGAAKYALFDAMRAPLVDRGYLEIGLDHFVRPGDSLARAAASGAISRNFQGYTDRRPSVLLGLGVSAISETPDRYHQNEKIITRYARRLERDELPALRGYALSPDDRRRRERILSLMTTLRAPLDADERDDARAYLDPLVTDGLVAIDPDELRILPAGRPFLRNVATVFDRHFRTSAAVGPVFSRAV